MRGIAKPPARSFARAAALALLLLAAISLGGCVDEEYQNKPRPPVAKTLSAFVGEDQIAYSPKQFGAGPTRFVITNQTGVNQKVTVSTDRLERSVSIEPQQTSEFKMTIEPGYLSIDADKSAADAAELEIGPERPSAQNDLDQP